MLTIYTGNTKKPILLDDDDFRLSYLKWTETPNGYAVTNIKHRGVYKTSLLHHMILDKKPKLDIDHINGNKLDCRKENLRHITRSENNFNRGAYHTNKLSVRGVYKSVRYVVDIRTPNKGKRFVKSFNNQKQAEEYAAMIYKEYSK